MQARKGVYTQVEGGGLLEAGVGVAKIGVLGLQVGKGGRQLIALLGQLSGRPLRLCQLARYVVALSCTAHQLST